MSKKQSFTNYSLDDINRFVTQKRDELRGLLFSVAGSKKQNVRQARILRHDIARALTERSSRTE